jgi:hypothetical protein
LNVAVSPNPSSDEINIVAPRSLKIESVKLSTMSGSQVIEKQGNNGSSVTLDIRNLNKGNYILQIMTNDGIIARKVSKE